MIHIFFFWNSYFFSFQGSLNFGESDVKIHFWSMYGACENLYEFRVTDDIIYQYYPSSQLFKSELCNRYPNMLLRSMVTIWKFKRLNLQLYCHLKKHTKTKNHIHLRGTSTVYQSIIFHNHYTPEGSVNGRSMNKLRTNALQNVQQHGCQPEIN